MNLTELCNEVYTITNRPDLVAETKAAVRSATLKLHQIEYFHKDIFETGINFGTLAYIHTFEYRTLFPKFRSLKYFRKAEASGEAGKFLEVLTTPEDVVDQYNNNKTDVCYVAGSALKVLSATEFQYGILGCYLYPDITEVGFSSWIALDHPFAIVYEAAGKVFKLLGKTEEFQAYALMAGDERQALIISNLSPVGY